MYQCLGGRYRLAQKVVVSRNPVFPCIRGFWYISDIHVRYLKNGVNEVLNYSVVQVAAMATTVEAWTEFSFLPITF